MKYFKFYDNINYLVITGLCIDVTNNIIVELGGLNMSTISKVLHRIAEESNGKMHIVKVPPEKRPTAESL